MTASASGLDPQISPLAAEVQIQGIAGVRQMKVEHIAAIIVNTTHKPLLGKAYVCVLELNMALDSMNHN